MAKVVCPAPGCQVTVMDCPHVPYYDPYSTSGIVIVDGPHRIVSTASPYELTEDDGFSGLRRVDRKGA